VPNLPTNAVGTSNPDITQDETLADCGPAVDNGGELEPVSDCNMLCAGNSSELYVVHPVEYLSLILYAKLRWPKSTDSV
jgi:hypothetical protein